MKNFSTLLKELKLSTTQEQLEEERYLVFDLEEDKDLYEGVYNYFNDESLDKYSVIAFSIERFFI